MKNNWPGIASLVVFLCLPSAAAGDGGADHADATSSTDGDADVQAVEGHADADHIRAMAGHVVLERSGDRLLVTEVFLLAVERPFDPPEGRWISLPAKAGAAKVFQGESFARAVPGGVELTKTLSKGQHTVAFSFETAAPEGRTLFGHAVPFLVAGLHVVWPEKAALSARAMGFTDGGTVNIKGRPMRILERGGLEPGQKIAIMTTGDRAAPAPQRRRAQEAADPLGWLVPVTLALAAVLFVFALIAPANRRLPGRNR